MARVVLTLIFTIMMIVLCAAQLNFTPGWGNGKRSVPIDQDNCKTSIDSLMYLYKLIQVITIETTIMY